MLEKLTPATDKLQHLYWGCYVLIFAPLIMNLQLCPFLLWFIGLALGAIREVWQIITKEGVADYWDVVWTSFVPFLVSLILMFN